MDIGIDGQQGIYRVFQILTRSAILTYMSKAGKNYGHHVSIWLFIKSTVQRNRGTTKSGMALWILGVKPKVV